MKRRALVGSLAFSLACAPDLGSSDGLVTTPQILAVKADPPEARPGAMATYTALVALPEGARDPGPVVWRFCTAPTPLTTDNSVSTRCFDASFLVDAGSGSSINAATDPLACALFGPQTPPGGLRPRDPDATGGYFQPLRAEVRGAEAAFYLARVLCGLGQAAADAVAQYTAAYVPNANPHLDPVTAAIDGAPIPLSAVPARSRVTLHASWPAADAETYAYFDPALQTLSARREAMRVAWHVRDGSVASSATGRAETDSATWTETLWKAPERTGHTTLWIVLRDNRGGTDFATYDVTVLP